MKTSRPGEAVKQLEKYLRVAPPQDAERTKAEVWLTNLQQQISNQGYDC
jgi:hypothetical protein